MTYRYQTFESPVGRIYLVADETHLHAVAFPAQWAGAKARFQPLEEAESPLLAEARRQLGDYFDGRRRAFDLPLKMTGSDFQLQAWEALSRIPFGRTATYGEQAAAMKRPNAARAVGRTNGLNLLCVVLPCHRVVGGDGSLTGYAGGLEAKRFLLALEGSHPTQSLLKSTRKLTSPLMSRAVNCHMLRNTSV